MPTNVIVYVCNVMLGLNSVLCARHIILWVAFVDVYVA